MDCQTCWVDKFPAQRIYRPYMWDGCPGLEGTSDWDMRYGLYTSTVTTTEQHVNNGNVTCIELKGYKVLMNQPTASQLSSGLMASSTEPLILNNHMAKGVGAIGGFSAAAVLGFRVMKFKKRQMKTTNAAKQGLEMSNANTV